MVEILLSLVFLVAAIALAIWPYAVIHDHTIDGLFLTLTGSMFILIFLFNFIRQMRFRGAQDVTAIQRAWPRLTRVLSAAFPKGGTDMRTILPRIRIPFIMGTLLLLLLAFPGTLYANNLRVSHQSPSTGDNQALTVVLPNRTLVGKILHTPPQQRERGLLMDADFRLRTAAELIGNPAIEKPAERARVPLRLLVLAARPLLEV
jgi:hypothetical protein